MPIWNVSIQRARFISGGCYNQENKKKNQPLVLRALGLYAVTKTAFPKFWRFSYLCTEILQFCETQSETTLRLLESDDVIFW